MINTRKLSTTAIRRWCRAACVGSARRRAGVFVLSALVVVGTPLTTNRTTAQPASHENEVRGGPRRVFTNASLNDRYGFHVLALTMNPADPNTGGSFPFAIAGYYEFMGDGSLAGKDVVSRGRDQQIVPREYAGTYQVNADGTGSLTLFISPTFMPEGRFIITKGGDEIEIIFAVPGNLNAFTLNKQHTH